MPSPLHHVTGLSRAVGWPNTLNILAQRACGVSRVAPLQLKSSVEKVGLSPTGSDLFVLSQVFGWREYDPGNGISSKLNQVAKTWRQKGITPLVIDGGANVGYSSLFFANLFPLATVVAVEPDPSTYERLCDNARATESIKPLRAAIWKHGDGVRFEQEKRGSWSNHVGEQGVLVPSRTLEQICQTVPSSRLLLLKLDVEGSEREVIDFSPDVVRSALCIMIEPHDFMHPRAAGLMPLFRAVCNCGFDTVISGENLFLFSPELFSEADKAN